MVVGVVLHRARTKLRKEMGIIWRNIMKSNNDFDNHPRQRYPARSADEQIDQR